MFLSEHEAFYVAMPRTIPLNIAEITFTENLHKLQYF